MREALQFAEGCMSEEVISAARLTDSAYGQMLTVLGELAELLAKRLIPAYKEDSQVCSEATEVFRQRLLASLTSYYGTKAVVAFEMTAEGLPDDAVLYGNVADQNGNPLSCSAFRVKNGEAQEYAFAVSGQETVTDSSGAVLAKADIKPVFTATHIQDNITPIVDGFSSSDWFGSISAEILSGEIAEDSLMIPFPLYSFPETPAMVQHEAVYEADETADTWRYAFTYTRAFHYPQQVCQCRVFYNTAGENKYRGDLSRTSALASIHQAGGAVLEDIRGLAKQILGSSSVRPDGQTAEAFRLAYSAALKLLTGLKEEMESTAGMEAVLRGIAQGETISFAVKEQQDEQQRFLMVLDLDGLEPEIPGYQAQKGQNGWLFVDEEGKYLSCADGQKIPKRRMILPEKKILQYQDGVAKLLVGQNRWIGGREMNEKLVYTTGEISFDSAVHAYRSIEKQNLAEGSTEARPLTEYLSAYLKRLTGEGRDLTIQALCSVSSRIYEGMEPVTCPVFSQAKTDISGDTVDAMVKGWNAYLKEWWAAYRETEPGEKEKVSFELHFFSKSTSVPLLDVKELYITGEHFSFT